MNFFKRKGLQLYIAVLKLINADFVTVSKAKYYLKNNKALNLNNPQELMEKLQWLKLYYYKEAYARFVDKYEVRRYVEDTVGNEYLNKIIGVFDDVESIDFDSLPEQFVLKCTHGSGYNIIVKDKSCLNIAKAKFQMKRYLKEDYSKVNQEAIYKGLKPRILAEYYMCDLCGENIIDYKFFCISGVTKCVWVKTFDNGLYKNCYYDLDWNKIPEEVERENFLDKEIKRPDNFDEMIEVAQKLSKEFIFMRVDLYSIKNRTLFGELTFFPWGGKQRITVERFNKEYGSLINLPIS